MLARALMDDYKISLTGKGLEAVEIASNENSRPDLILLDINLPEISGYQVCTLLKENKCTKDIPIIFISARSSEADEARGLELGAVDYIIKPFSLPIVKARVRTQIEIKNHREYFERLSHHDSLTGAANRRRFDELISREWRRACRCEALISLILLDVDDFGMYSDRYGHAEADACLVKVVKAISGATGRASDFLARYQGVVFAILLPQTDAANCLALAQKMHKAVEELQVPHQHAQLGKVSISIGVSTLRAHRDQSVSALLNQTEVALQKAWEKGRNQIVVYDASGKQDISLECDYLRRLRRAVAGRHLSEADWNLLTGLLEQWEQEARNKV